MHAPLPLLSFVLWLRFGLAAAVMVWLPGFVILGGRWRIPTGFEGFLLQISAGLILPFVYAAGPGRLGAPFTPIAYLAFVLLAGATVRWWTPRTGPARAFRLTPASAESGTPPTEESTACSAGLAAAAVVLSFVLLVMGYGHLPAPPHVHDAVNHAWLTRRIAQDATLSWSALSQETAGTLGLGYLPGLHAAAALIARVGGLAPYVSIWMSALLVAAFIPAAWWMLWRAWGASAFVAGCASLLIAANPLGPAGVLGWGGFGQVAGFFVVPAAALMLRAATDATSREGRARWWTAVGAGLFLGGLVHLHAAEVLVSLVAAWLIPARARFPLDRPAAPSGGPRKVAGGTRSGRAPAARVAWGVGGVALGFLALCGPELWELARRYPSEIAAVPVATKPVGDALWRLWKAGGGGHLVRLLVLGGWGLALRSGRWRKAAIVSGLLGLWYLALLSRADPLSRWLSTPFYRQAPRLLYLQLYFSPLWAALALAFGLRWWARRRPRPGAAGNRPGDAGRVARGLVLGIAAALALLAAPRLVTNYRNGGTAVPFTLDDYHHAVEISRIVPPDAVVANLWDDGSAWAMQVSDRNFLLPCAWDLRTPEGRSVHELARGLAEDPWPEATARLVDAHSIAWLYVSDGVWRDGSGLRRADFEDDPRFEPIVVGKQSTLYRIRRPWDPAARRRGSSGPRSTREDQVQQGNQQAGADDPLAPAQESPASPQHEQSGDREQGQAHRVEIGEPGPESLPVIEMEEVHLEQTAPLPAPFPGGVPPRCVGSDGEVLIEDLEGRPVASKHVDIVVGQGQVLDDGADHRVAISGFDRGKTAVDAFDLVVGIPIGDVVHRDPGDGVDEGERHAEIPHVAMDRLVPSPPGNALLIALSNRVGHPFSFSPAGRSSITAPVAWTW